VAPSGQETKNGKPAVNKINRTTEKIMRGEKKKKPSYKFREGSKMSGLFLKTRAPPSSLLCLNSVSPRRESIENFLGETETETTLSLSASNKKKKRRQSENCYSHQEKHHSVASAPGAVLASWVCQEPETILLKRELPIHLRSC